MTSSTSTSRAISPDSGEHWAAEGAWQVAEGIHRIPLPLPMDGLRAVNVYVLETDRGITLVDGGWAIPESRAVLDRSLAQLGYATGDITAFLVTHAHRDHFTQASAIGLEHGAHISLGSGERGTLEVLNGDRDLGRTATHTVLRSAGALDLARRWQGMTHEALDLDHWRYPDTWLDGDHELRVGERTLAAVHTPGHTQGHYVFAEHATSLLFAGDHVLPTITPSIGFEAEVAANPLGDFMASLTKVRGLPDLRLLPAHGPVAPSSHARVDELLAHHEERLARCVDALGAGPATAYDVAGQLPWTRHEHAFATLDFFNAALATMETKAHLELLVARGQVTGEPLEEGTVFTLIQPTAQPQD